MATDFRISTGLPGHLKTQMVIERLGTGAMWHWVCLCAYTAQNRPTGDLSGITVEGIELAAKWPEFRFKSGPYKGKSSRGIFAEVLMEVGFLEVYEGGIRWHDWDEHQIWVTGEVRRKEIGKLAADKRWEARRNALMKAQQCIAHAESIAEMESEQCPSPSLSLPNQSLPKTKAELPDWIMLNPELLESWKAFIEMRKRIRAPLTKHAINLTLGELEKLADHGNDPKQVLDQSVARSWRGIFEVKGNANGNGITKAQQRQNSNIDAAKAAIARIKGVDREGVDGTGDGDERDFDARDAGVVRNVPVRPDPVTLEGVIRKMP